MNKAGMSKAGMGKTGWALAALCMVADPALAQTAFKDAPQDVPQQLTGRQFDNAPQSFSYSESNAERRLTDSLPGAWRAEQQVLSAVQAVTPADGAREDGVTFYATSRRTVLSWRPGGGLDDANISRSEVNPGQASVGVAYRTGGASIGLAYVNREYSQRLGAQTVSQSEDFAGLTMKLELGGR